MKLTPPNVDTPQILSSTPHNIFLIGDPLFKIKAIEDAVQAALTGQSLTIPSTPAREAAVSIPPSQHPPKKGFASAEGRARLLHDLANIELQAMELGLRTLFEFPEAPEGLRRDLADLTISESRHLQMCLEAIEDLGFSWGHWPIHLGLWEAVSDKDTLVDRMFIVHRYLEGSGLDAQDTMLRRLEGIDDRRTLAVLKQIHREEVDHVYFGTKWHLQLCQDQTRTRAQDLRDRLQRLRTQLPRRLQPICHRWRLQAGFSPEELEVLEEFRQSCLAPLV